MVWHHNVRPLTHWPISNWSRAHECKIIYLKLNGMEWKKGKSMVQFSQWEWCSLARCKSRATTRLTADGAHTCTFKHNQQLHSQRVYMKGQRARTWKALVSMDISCSVISANGVRKQHSLVGGGEGSRRTLLIRRKSEFTHTANV